MPVQTMTRDRINQLTEEIKGLNEPFQRIVSQVDQVLVGQERLVHRIDWLVGEWPSAD